MRDLINLIESLMTEPETLSEVNLSVEGLTKEQKRFDRFIEMIRNGEPVTLAKDDSEVVIDPEEADRFLSMRQDGTFKGTIKIQLADGGIIKLSDILKTPDFGGQSTGGKDGAGPGKEAALMKPKQIGITDRDIPGSELGDEIINNQVLQSTDYGQAVIEMAKTIMAGGTATIPDFPDSITKSIVDYAGEYLGVLALVLGRSNFPKREGFEKWLGSDVGSLVVNFPGKSNLALADSVAVPLVKNAKTNHAVYISSKGTGGGAAPAVSGLEVPDEVREDPQYEAAVAFVDLCNNKLYNTTATIASAFAGMNLLYKYAPDSIPSEFNQFLPWDIEDISAIVNQNRLAFKEGNPQPMPEYESLWSGTKFQKPASDGGKLVYVVKSAVIKAINSGDAIPNFADALLMILDMNFVQQYADFEKKSRQLRFATQWPARLEGKVKLETKSSAKDPVAGGFSFKLARTDEEIKVPQPDEGPKKSSSTAPSEKKFKEKAKAIALGIKDLDEPSKKSMTGNAGRKKR
jgi:hypothetical protein